MGERNALTAWLLLVVLGLASTARGAATGPIDGVMAVVNNDVVTYAEVRSYLAQFARAGRTVDRKLVEKTLNELINNRLLLHAAREEGITVSSDEVNAEVARLAAQFDTMTDYLMYLSDKLHMTLREQKKIIESQLMRRRWIREKMGAELYVPPKEMRQYYLANKDEFVRPERRHVRMISVHFDQYENREAARPKIDDIRKRLVAGEDFALLAKRVSNDPRRAEGGDHGWIEKGKWALREAAEAAFKLAPGQLSDVIQSAFGYHVLRVEAILPSAPMSFQEAQARIRQILVREHNDAMIERYVKELRAKAYIHIVGEETGPSKEP